MTKITLESIAKYAGFATVAIEWSALSLYYLKMPLYFGNKYPISYFATLTETKWIFTVCYVLAALSFWIFAKHHIAKYYQVPMRIFGICLLLFAGVGVFPYDPYDAVSTLIHTGLALTSGVLFLIGMYLIAARTTDKTLANVTVTAIIASFGLTTLFLLSPKDSHLVFMFEAGSWLVLQLWTIWISLHIHRRNRSKANEIEV